MKTSQFKLSTIALAALATSTVANADNYRHRNFIPSVVVTVKNQAAQRGAFQTPVWAGIHDGTFDLYDRDVALGDTDANPNLISRESVERIAEDGITSAITDEFSLLQPGAAQTTLLAPGGPLQPGSQSSTTLNIDNPFVNRFFSYASMVIPSNDAFVANGNPLVHEIFDERGRFVAENFIVAGNEVLDAGTEVNDEIASNTAFLNQAGPNIGAEENGVITLSQGFAKPGALPYPNGVLNHPVFANADFTADGARTLEFGFRYVNLGGRVRLVADLSPDQEVGTELIDSKASGRARLTARNGEQLSIRANFRGLSGTPTAAHLHLGQAGVNGPVVADLAAGLRHNSVYINVRANDVTGPLAESDDPFLSLLNELAAGNIYVNIHTAENPGGELRGQVSLR